MQPAWFHLSCVCCFVLLGMCCSASGFGALLAGPVTMNVGACSRHPAQGFRVGEGGEEPCVHPECLGRVVGKFGLWLEAAEPRVEENKSCEQARRWHDRFDDGWNDRLRAKRRQETTSGTNKWDEATIRNDKSMVLK